MKNKNTKEQISEYLTLTGVANTDSTNRNKRDLFRRFLNFLGDRELSFEICVDYMQGMLQRNLTPNTINTEFRNIKSFIKWQAEQEYIPKNYASKLKTPKISVRPEFDDIPMELAEKIIIAGTEPVDFVPRVRGDTPRNKYIKQEMRDGLCFILRTGLRIGEAIRLLGSDLNIENEYPTSRIAPSKGHSDEEGYPTQDILPMLKARAGRDRVFEITPSGCNDALQRGVKILKIRLRKRFTVHTLRHIYASTLIKNDVSISLVRRLMRHSDISITDKMYTHLFEKEKSMAANSLPIVRTSLDPREVLKDATRRISELGIMKDDRFVHEVTENDEEFTVHIKRKTSAC